VVAMTVNLTDGIVDMVIVDMSSEDTVLFVVSMDTLLDDGFVVSFCVHNPT
jgi:hypothetical protein